MLDVVNLLPNPPQWKHVAEFTVTTNNEDGQTSEVLRYLKNPLFPGGHIVPVIGAGKVVYKIAAFFPKDSRLGALSDLGKYWVCGLYLKRKCFFFYFYFLSISLFCNCRK